MPEPTSSGAAAITAAGPAVVTLTFFGVPTGLQPDQLLAGFLGAIAAIALLDSVPSTGDTWRELIRTSLKRIGVAVGSAVTAGYVAPVIALVNGIPATMLLGITFIVGAGAQRILRSLIERAADRKQQGATAKEENPS